MENKILKLNHPCEICKKEILIGDGTIIKNRPLHFDCYKSEIKSNTLKEVEEILEEYFDDLYIQIGMIGFAVPISNVKGKGDFRVDLKQRLAELGGVKE